MIKKTYMSLSELSETFLLSEEEIEEIRKMQIAKEEDLETVTDALVEILNLPEVQPSRKALEYGKVVDIVRHALERQYILGTLEQDFPIIKEER